MTTNQTIGRKPSAAELRNRTPLGGQPIPPGATTPATPKVATASPAPSPVTSTAIAPLDRRAVAVSRSADYVSRYLDEVAPANIVGRMIKFSKEGEFVTPDDEKGISEDQDFI